jgi:hypothetical protein
MILKIQAGNSATLGYARQLKAKTHASGFTEIRASKSNEMR